VVDETDQYESNDFLRRPKRHSTAEIMKGIYERNMASRHQHQNVPTSPTPARAVVATCETSKLTSGNGHNNYGSSS